MNGSNNNNSISVDTGPIIGNGNNLIDDRVNNNHLATSGTNANNHRTGNSTNNGGGSGNATTADLDLKHFIVEKKELKSSPSSPSSGAAGLHHQQLNLVQAGSNGLNPNGAAIGSCGDTKDTKVRFVGRLVPIMKRVLHSVLFMKH